MSANGKFNWALVAAAFIAALPPTGMGWLSWQQSQETHIEINSRMTRLLELTETSAKALGVKEERARQENADERQNEKQNGDGHGRIRPQLPVRVGVRLRLPHRLRGPDADRFTGRSGDSV